MTALYSNTDGSWDAIFRRQNMQATFSLTASEMTDLLHWVDSDGKPIYLKDTAFGERMRTFQLVEEIMAFARTATGAIRPASGLCY
jgi:hypothetical protein